MESLEIQVRKFIADTFLFGDPAAVPGDDESLLESGVIDSVGILELIGYIEKQFEIRVDDRELVPDNLDSIRKIAHFVARKTGDKGK